jgi:hypothetical protein
MSFPPFRGCASLQEINVATGNTFLKSINGVLFSADETILKRYPSRRDGTSYTVPETVEIDPSLGETPSLWHSSDLEEWSLVEEAARQGNVFTLPTATARLVGSQSFFKILP